MRYIGPGAVLSIIFMLVSLVAVFSFVALLSWIKGRRREREAFYHSEVLKKMVDKPEAGGQNLLEMMRQEERNAQIRRREGLKLGSLIVTAVGAGLIVFLAAVDRDEPAWVCGVIPLLIGIAMFAYVYLLAPKINE
jgi:uncharacterized membrane protein (GlpM family)